MFHILKLDEQFQHMVLEHLAIHMQKKKKMNSYPCVKKNKKKIGTYYICKCKTEKYKNSGINIVENLHLCILSTVFILLVLDNV